MCREPLWEGKEWRPVLPDGRQGVYDVMIYHNGPDGTPSSYHIEVIGWCADLDDVLENCILQGRKFRDVIMDDSTEIYGQD